MPARAEKAHKRSQLALWQSWLDNLTVGKRD
jgi:hypothetical protein